MSIPEIVLDKCNIFQEILRNSSYIKTFRGSYLEKLQEDRNIFYTT